MPHLPEEILQQIFAYLPSGSALEEYDRFHKPRKQVEPLLDLFLASKTFNRLARPAMYHTIHLHFYTLFQRRALLQTLIQHPATASMVVSLTSKWGWEAQEKVDFTRRWRVNIPLANHPPWGARDQQRFDGPVTGPNPPPAGQAKLFKKAADRLNLPVGLRLRLRNDHAAGLEDAELALMICLCKRRRFTELRSPNRAQNSLVFRVMSELMSEAAEITTPFTPRLHCAQHLNEIRLGPAAWEDSIDISHLAVFLQMP